MRSLVNQLQIIHFLLFKVSIIQWFKDKSIAGLRMKLDNILLKIKKLLITRVRLFLLRC